MRWPTLLILISTLLSVPGGTTNRQPAASRSRPIATNLSSPRFVWVDAYIDPKGVPLAAYQFELTARGADVALVGVEGGEHRAFIQPPYYDLKANVRNRIIIAGFSTAGDLPQTRARVARVMLRVSGNESPSYSAKLQVAASPEAKPIEAQVEVLEGAAQ